MKKKEIKDNLKNLLEIKNQTSDSVDLYIYGDIVSDWWGAWQAEDQYPESIKNFIVEANGREINAHINSGGGSVFAGIAIYNMLAHYDGTVNVFVDGLAASIASVIAMAGDSITMRTGSMLMIHKPAFGLIGMYNSDELLKMAADLEEVQTSIMSIYEKKRKEGCTAESLTEMVNNETWLTTEEAASTFDVDIEEVEAVACTSEYIEKFLNAPPQYAEREGKDERKIEPMEYEFLKMEEIKK